MTFLFIIFALIFSGFSGYYFIGLMLGGVLVPSLNASEIAGWTGVAPARSHKPNYAGSIPAPATNPFTTFRSNQALVLFM